MRLTGLLCWALMMLGCLTLVLSPQLPWTTSPSSDGIITVNGFNGATYLSGSNSLAAQLESLGATQQDLSSLSSFSDDGSGDPAVIPSLQTIPAYLGGSDTNANWGIFVLVPGAIATFTAIWTLWGERDRRRSMIGGIFVLGALTLIPLLHELSKMGLTFASSSGDSTGVGIFAGLLGALFTMIASGTLFLRMRL